MTVLFAASTTQAILFGVAAGLAVVVIAAFGFGAVRRRREAPGPDIPPAMKPAPSDPDLEKPVLEKLLGWGALCVMFLAVFIPIVWLREPTSNVKDLKILDQESVARGAAAVQLNSQTNPEGIGCVRCHGSELQGGVNVFNGNIVPVPDLKTECGGAAYGHPQIKSLADMINTIAQGRTGTDMPSWSVRYSGSLDDQQINDIVNYILSIQTVPVSQNVCLNPNAGVASPSPTASG